MVRYQGIDILKGIAVICMVIFHFFYFPNQYGFKEINYNTPVLNTIGSIARYIFIMSVGINLSLSNQSVQKEKGYKEEYNKKNIKRILKIFFFAILMSLFTYMIFGNKYVKFGILHFIGLSSLILFPFIENKKIIEIFTIFSILIYYLIIYKPDIFSKVPQPVAFISGFYNKKIFIS